MIRPYLNGIIYYHKTQGEWKTHSGNAITEQKTQGEWKIHLTMTINFISSKYSNETLNMHTKSNNLEIMIGSETNKIIEERFKSFLQRYQEGLEESVRGSEFNFNSIDSFYCDFNKISLSRCG